MRKYIEKTVKVKSVEAIYCDMCGSSCEGAEDMFGINYATLHTTWDHGSKNDGVEFEIHLCEGCFYSVLGFIRNERQKVLIGLEYPHDNDPLYGEQS